MLTSRHASDAKVYKHIPVLLDLGCVLLPSGQKNADSASLLQQFVKNHAAPARASLRAFITFCGKCFGHGHHQDLSSLPRSAASSVLLYPCRMNPRISYTRRIQKQKSRTAVCCF